VVSDRRARRRSSVQQQGPGVEWSGDGASAGTGAKERRERAGGAAGGAAGASWGGTGQHEGGEGGAADASLLCAGGEG
jgi:hypothetical protein